MTESTNICTRLVISRLFLWLLFTFSCPDLGFALVSSEELLFDFFCFMCCCPNTECGHKHASECNGPCCVKRGQAGHSVDVTSQEEELHAQHDPARPPCRSERRAKASLDDKVKRHQEQARSNRHNDKPPSPFLSKTAAAAVLSRNLNLKTFFQDLDRGLLSITCVVWCHFYSSFYMFVLILHVSGRGVQSSASGCGPNRPTDVPPAPPPINESLYLRRLIFFRNRSVFRDHMAVESDKHCFEKMPGSVCASDKGARLADALLSIGEMRFSLHVFVNQIICMAALFHMTSLSSPVFLFLNCFCRVFCIDAQYRQSIYLMGDDYAKRRLYPILRQIDVCTKLSHTSLSPTSRRHFRNRVFQLRRKLAGLVKAFENATIRVYRRHNYCIV